jgi:hypothetical protein
VRDRGDSSRAVNQRVRDLQRVRAEDARLRARAQQERQREKRERYQFGHTVVEHVDVGDDQLARRAATGVNARGQPGRPTDASRWTSDAAAMRAAERLWCSAEARQRKERAEEQVRSGTLLRQDAVVAVRRPLPEVLGPTWRGGVYGRSRASNGQEAIRFTARSSARAVWRMRPDGRWYLYTCFPSL